MDCGSRIDFCCHAKGWAYHIPQLVGGLEHVLFSHVLGIIIPTDFHIFQRGRYTTNQTKTLDFLERINNHQSN